MPEDNTRARARSGTQNSSFRVLADTGFPLLSEEAVAAAARCVASYCAAKAKPLTLVLHGGGEPTMHWELLTRAWSVCSNVAREEGIRMWSYIATHGILAEGRVRWLAKHFDLIGLSCDGPPDIQNTNRPSTTGADTSRAVERTAAILNSQNAGYTVRATITVATTTRQAEIVEYLCDRLFARTIRFEPAYDGRRVPGGQFHPKDADAFVSHYVEAQEIARSRGCDLQLSGVRLDEIHGPFCNPLRDVLQITPDGRASACFLSVGNDEAADDAMAIGRLDPATGDFVINRERVASQRLQAAGIPPQCEDCHNIYHCARDCPDVCLLSGPVAPGREEGFRCRVQKLLARHNIFEMATSMATREGAIPWPQ